jgi:hypothetical protein
LSGYLAGYLAWFLQLQNPEGGVDRNGARVIAVSTGLLIKIDAIGDFCSSMKSAGSAREGEI